MFHGLRLLRSGAWVKDHLTTKLEDVKTDRNNWERVDAFLYTLLQQFIDPFTISTLILMCYDFWSQFKSLYTDVIQCLYSVLDKSD